MHNETRGHQGCPKKAFAAIIKTISGNKISNFKTFGTTGSNGSFPENLSKNKPLNLEKYEQFF